MPSVNDLHYVSGDNYLAWTWDGANPDIWNLDTSADGVSGWNYSDNDIGTVRFLSEDPNGFARIYGIDGSGAMVTGYSNVCPMV
jgi:hypothetical protein